MGIELMEMPEVGKGKNRGGQVHFESEVEEKQEREKIENDMLNMATGMKEFANNFKT